MLQSVRYDRILQEIESRKAVKVTSLSEELGVSESTVRRDINELDKIGKLRKVFGGAVSLDSGISAAEEDVLTKESLNILEKDSIARYAASLINDNDFVFIDAGTTTFRLIDHITNKKATFVTNGIMAAEKLMNSGCKTYIIGGGLKAVTQAVVGAEAVENIRKYNFTKSFMGTNGIDAARGFTTPDIDESMVKTAAMEHSYISYVLADHTKFGVISSVSFAEIGDAIVITDSLTDQELKKKTVIKEVGE